MKKEYTDPDQEIREKILGQTELPPDLQDREPAKNWQRIEALLDENPDQQKSKSPFLWVAAAVLILLLAGLSWLSLKDADNTSLPYPESDEPWVAEILDPQQVPDFRYQNPPKENVADLPEETQLDSTVMVTDLWDETKEFNGRYKMQEKSLMLKSEVSGKFKDLNNRGMLGLSGNVMAGSYAENGPPPPPPAFGHDLDLMSQQKSLEWSFGGEEQFQSDYWSREYYSPIFENSFEKPFQEPLSTFSIDVDAASYANMRRYINSGSRPPKDAIRVEEMVNYFAYDYEAPKQESEIPFNLIAEVATCPWATDHKLVHLGLKGKEIQTDDLPPSNLVFLIDVSGSMSSWDKLPMLKQSFSLLVEQLRPQDRVSMVVYAGAAGTVLEPTAGDHKVTILNALDKLEAGGSTAGAAGIQLAYQLAGENYLPEGNNRVILATDGDFNVGPASDAELEKIIEEKRKEGVFLSVLGFGTGNYQDGKMQTLADKGNGNHYYIDNLNEARKVLVSEFGGTLFAIAKDVKLQVEFNPALVESYRLIGYENRMLAAEDFDDDTKDAGELGAGHTVTALYEIVPVEGKVKDENGQLLPAATASNEWLNLKVRYKDPDAEKSKLLMRPIKKTGQSFDESSENFRWSAAVAGFGLLLRNSEHKGQVNFEQVLEIARSAQGEDVEGYRKEFIELVEQMQLIGLPEPPQTVLSN